MAVIPTAVAAAPVQIYTAPTLAGVTPHVTIANEGSSAIYVGQAPVQAGSGFPLWPGLTHHLPQATSDLYAACGYTTTSTKGTLSSAAAAGGTALAVAPTTNMAAGQYVQIGSGSAAEAGSVTAVNGGTQVVVSPALSYDHAVSASVTVVTVAGSSVLVTAGVT